MRLDPLAVGFFLLLSGCSGGGPADPTESPAPSVPPPREVLAKAGNTATCSEVLQGAQTFPFRVDPGYSILEVTWWASGHGLVGYEIKDAQSTVAARADYNPGNTPCDHATHGTGTSENFTAKPGDYEAVVRNTGILGWTLNINELAKPGQASEHH